MKITKKQLRRIIEGVISEQVAHVSDSDFGRGNAFGSVLGAAWGQYHNMGHPDPDSAAIELAKNWINNKAPNKSAAMLALHNADSGGSEISWDTLRNAVSKQEYNDAMYDLGSGFSGDDFYRMQDEIIEQLEEAGMYDEDAEEYAENIIRNWSDVSDNMM